MRNSSGYGGAASVFIIAAADVVRAGLESLVAQDARFTVAGGAPDLTGLAAEEAEGAWPDVVIFDVERQSSEWRAPLRAIIDETDEGRAAPAFVLIGVEQDEALTEALRAGVVRALLPRVATGGEIIAAVAAVAAGLVVIDAEIFAALLAPPSVDALRSEPPITEQLPSAVTEVEALTPREREVLTLLAEGLANKEIAWRLKISEHTVKFHIASVFAKLNVATRTEAVMQGIRRGLIMV